MLKIFKITAILEGISYLVLFSNMLFIKPTNIGTLQNIIVSYRNESWYIIYWLYFIGLFVENCSKLEF